MSDFLSDGISIQQAKKLAMIHLFHQGMIPNFNFLMNDRSVMIAPDEPVLGRFDIKFSDVENGKKTENKLFLKIDSFLSVAPTDDLTQIAKKIHVDATIPMNFAKRPDGSFYITAEPGKISITSEDCLESSKVMVDNRMILKAIGWTIQNDEKFAKKSIILSCSKISRNSYNIELTPAAKYLASAAMLVASYLLLTPFSTTLGVTICTAAVAALVHTAVKSCGNIDRIAFKSPADSCLGK